MQKYLITIEEVMSLARDMSKHIDKPKIEVYLRESEYIDIKSALGDALFLDVKEHSEKYSTLLDGGVYETECGVKKMFAGLKTALAYYTFARVVKNGSEYSSHADLKEKMIAYNDAFDVANQYLKECVIYLNDNKKQFPLYKGRGGIKANKTVFRILGE